MRSPAELGIIETGSHWEFRRDRLFSDLPRKALDAYDAIKSRRVYPEGTLLFVEGQPPLGVYLLCTGRVKVSIASPKRKTRILRIAEPGELLGLSATISGWPHEASAEALEPCQAEFVKREDFLRFLCQHSEVCLRGRSVSMILRHLPGEFSVAINHSGSSVLEG